jgi:hypothetical protein
MCTKNLDHLWENAYQTIKRRYISGLICMHNTCNAGKSMLAITKWNIIHTIKSATLHPLLPTGTYLLADNNHHISNIHVIVQWDCSTIYSGRNKLVHVHQRFSVVNSAHSIGIITQRNSCHGNAHATLKWLFENNLLYSLQLSHGLDTSAIRFSSYWPTSIFVCTGPQTDLQWSNTD